MIRQIPLTNSDKVAIIDSRDFGRVRLHKWCLNKGRYVLSTDHPQIFLHHLINGNPPKGFETDHENTNELDNRRKNLRNATISQNQMNRRRNKNNTSGFKGVHWFKRTGRWVVHINISGKQKHLGYFDDVIEAARTYDRAAFKNFGKFARLNFLVRRFPRD